MDTPLVLSAYRYQRLFPLGPGHRILEAGLHPGVPGTWGGVISRHATTYVVVESLEALYQTSGEGYDAVLATVPWEIEASPRAFSLIMAGIATPKALSAWVTWGTAHLQVGGYLFLRVPLDLAQDAVQTTHRGFCIVAGGLEAGALTLIAQRRAARVYTSPAADAADALCRIWEAPTQDPLPTPPLPEPLHRFHSGFGDPQQWLDLAAESPLVPQQLGLWSRSGKGPGGLPPHPLKPGHLALELASGHFDGPVGTGDLRHRVKGQVLRRRTQFETTDDEGELMTVTADHLTVAVHTLLPDGTLQSFLAEGDPTEEDGGSL